MFRVRKDLIDVGILFQRYFSKRKGADGFNELTRHRGDENWNSDWNEKKIELFRVELSCDGWSNRLARYGSFSKVFSGLAR